MIKKDEHSKYILNENKERRIRLSFIPENDRVIISTGTTTSRTSSFVIHYDFICAGIKQGWYLFYNIKNIDDCKKFLKLNSMSDRKKSKSKYWN